MGSPRPHLRTGRSGRFLHYDWLVKPYVQAGMAWDAAARQSSYLCFVGATARRSWDLDGHRLTWGGGLSGAYQEVRHGNDRSSLLMLQTGVDYEFDEWFRLVGHEVTPSLCVGPTLFRCAANRTDTGGARSG